MNRFCQRDRIAKDRVRKTKGKCIEYPELAKFKLLWMWKIFQGKKYSSPLPSKAKD
jgi:hypothetical protein